MSSASARHPDDDHHHTRRQHSYHFIKPQNEDRQHAPTTITTKGTIAADDFLPPPPQSLMNDMLSTQQAIPDGLIRNHHNHQNLPLSAGASTSTTASPFTELSPAYAFSDGATSSDTDASIPNSHASDTEGDLGPFTPLTPSNPASSSAPSSTHRHQHRLMTVDVPNASSVPGPSANPWKPRELRLVGRQREASSSDNDQITALTGESYSRSGHGLGIQLPKSPAFGVPLPPRSPVPGSNRQGASPDPSASPNPNSSPNPNFFSSFSPNLSYSSDSNPSSEAGRFPDYTTSSGQTRTKKGLKALALPSRPLASSDSRTNQRSKPLAANSSTYKARSPRISPNPNSPALTAPRAGISPSLGYTGEWSTLPAPPSWATESERAAAVQAAKLPSVLHQQPSIDSQPRRRSRRRSKSVSPKRKSQSPRRMSNSPRKSTSPLPNSPSPQRTSPSPRLPQCELPSLPEDTPPISHTDGQPASPSNNFVPLSPQRQSRLLAARKKAPPAPLLFLSNDPSLNRASTSASDALPTAADSQPKSAATSEGEATLKPTNAGMPSWGLLRSTQNMLSPAPLTAPLVSPAFSIYHEAPSSPAPPLVQSHAEESDTAAVEQDAPTESIKRVSTPLHTARIRFDTADNVSEDGSISDYGSESSFGASQSRISPSKYGPADMSALLAGISGATASSEASSRDVSSADPHNRDTGTSHADSHDTLATTFSVSSLPDHKSADEAEPQRQVRQSTPQGNQDGLSASSSLNTIPSAPATSEDVSLDHFSTSERDSQSMPSRDSTHEAFEYDGSMENAAESPVDLFFHPRTPRPGLLQSPKQPVVPTSPTSRPRDASITLDSADAEGSIDPDFILPNTDISESRFSQGSWLSSAMDFASPPLRAGPLGTLLRSDGPQQRDVHPSTRVGSDLSINFNESFSPRLGREQLLKKDPQTETTDSGMLTHITEVTEPPSEVNTLTQPSRDAGMATARSTYDIAPHSDEPEQNVEDPQAQSHDRDLDRSSAVIRFHKSPSEDVSAASTADASSDTATSATAGPPMTENHAGRAMTESPSFNTKIFKVPALPRRTPTEDQQVGPRDLTPRTASHVTPSDFVPPSPFSPASDLYMRSLPERSQRPTPTIAIPPPDSTALAERPRLTLNTDSPRLVGDAFKSTPANTADFLGGGIRQSPCQSPIAASPIRPMFFPEARSAPLMQGAFPSPDLVNSPFTPHFAAFGTAPNGVSEDDNFGGLCSRWSSGSESDEEAPKRTSKTRRASKKRSSSTAPSARSSVSGAAAMVPVAQALAQVPAPGVSRKSLFQSLGLRKKSLPNLNVGSSVGSKRDSNRSSNSGTPASHNSPALPRHSQAGSEFPFPGTPSGSVPPETMSTKSLRPSGLAKQKPSLTIQPGALPVLNRKQSSSSLRTNSSGRASPTAGDAPVTSAASGTPPESPGKEKDKAIHSFGIPMPRRRSRASSRASANHPVPPMPAHARTQPNPASEVSDKAAAAPEIADRETDLTSAPRVDNPRTPRSGWMRPPRLNGASKTSQQPPASLPTIASMSFPVEQGDQDAAESTDPPQSTVPDVEPVEHVATEAPRSGTPTSTEATPRVAYLSLGPQERSIDRDRSKAVMQQGDPEALSSIGQGFVDSVLSPEAEREDPLMRKTIDNSDLESSRTVQVAKQGSKRIPRRVAKYAKWMRQRQYQQVTPHYPSMTDVGRLWVAEHPGENLGDARGPRIAQYSGGRISSGQQRFSQSGQGQEADESSSDDYGESEDGNGFGDDGGGQNGGSGGGANGDEDDDSDDDDAALPIIGDDEDDVSSEESEDEYGAADEDATGGLSESSDDVPLGQQYDHGARVQSRLLAQERKRERSKAVASQSTLRQQSSSGSNGKQRVPRSQPLRDISSLGGQGSDGLNPNELAARLTTLQMRPGGRGNNDQSANAHAQSDARGSLRQSPEVARGASGTISHDQASSLARARSLAHRARQRGFNGDSEASNASSESRQARARRASDAASRRHQMPMPPVSAMPVSAHPWSNSAMPSSLLASLPTNAHPAVSKAAMVVATQAARDGKIPAAAIPLQAQALALQATQAGAAPGIVSSSPMSHRPSGSQQVNALPSSDDGIGDVPSETLSRGSSTNTTRRRPLGVDTRVAPPMSSPMPSSSGASIKSPTLPSGPTPADEMGVNAADRASISSAGRRGPSANAQAAPSINAPVTVRMQQHKVYIVNKQRFAQCEVPLSARARDLVLDTLDRETVQMTAGRGAWVVFEVSPMFGIERPLREYEVISQVADAMPDPAFDHFLLKQTELAPYLSLRAVPAVSPTLAGYVYVRDRRGKWSKRFLELRDHSLYHAKSEKGKEEVFICHLSSFDVYLSDGKSTKAPKAHSFCMRSQDKISMFENKDDYIHYFCLSDPSAHRDWIRAITNARTYILKQEHTALFQLPAVAAPSQQQKPNAVVTGLAGSVDTNSNAVRSNASLSRRGTTKRPNADASMKHSIDSADHHGISSLVPSDAFAHGPFEKGSLLANEMRRARSGANSSGGGAGLQSEDLTTHERTRVRMEQERARAEIADRQRRLREEGKPLVSLGDLLRRPE